MKPSSSPKSILYKLHEPQPYCSSAINQLMIEKLLLRQMRNDASKGTNYTLLPSSHIIFSLQSKELQLNSFHALLMTRAQFAAAETSHVSQLAGSPDENNYKLNFLFLLGCTNAYAQIEYLKRLRTRGLYFRYERNGQDHVVKAKTNKFSAKVVLQACTWLPLL